MDDPFFVQACRALARHFHEVNPAARRIHLLTPEHIRRAHRQTEPAVDALVDDFTGGRMVLVESAGATEFCLFARHQMPPTTRPLLIVPLGSNCCFSARISKMESPAV